MDKLGKGCVVYADEVETLKFDWGKIRLLSEPGLTGAEMMTFGRVELSPGAGHDRHNHPDTEEIIYCVSGEGEQTVDDEGPVHVRPGASIFVPNSAYHSTLNTGTETMVLLVVYCPVGAEKDLRSLPDCRVLPPEPVDA